MKTVAKLHKSKRLERGYALLLITFFVALLALATLAAAPNVITNARRDQEEEMIWRGKQYVRGIRMFYTKQHRFPQKLEDLYKPKTGMRFMRQAFKDPVNTTDGEWRLIYVGPNGMLIGSTKNRTVNIPAQGGGAVGVPAGSAGNGFGLSSNLQSSNSTFGGSSSSSSTPSGNPPNPGVNGAAGGGQDQADGQNSTDASGTLQEPTFTDTSGIIGGNIIGVGSKVNKQSIRWYEKAHNYRQFEFVWDPAQDGVGGQQAGIPLNNSNGIGSPAGGTPTTTSPFSPGGSSTFPNSSGTPLSAPPTNPGSPTPQN